MPLHLTGQPLDPAVGRAKAQPQERNGDQRHYAPPQAEQEHGNQREQQQCGMKNRLRKAEGDEFRDAHDVLGIAMDVHSDGLLAVRGRRRTGLAEQARRRVWLRDWPTCADQSVRSACRPSSTNVSKPMATTIAATACSRPAAK